MMRRLLLIVAAIMLVLGGAFTASPRVSAAPDVYDGSGRSAVHPTG